MYVLEYWTSDRKHMEWRYRARTFIRNLRALLFDASTKGPTLSLFVYSLPLEATQSEGLDKINF